MHAWFIRANTIWAGALLTSCLVGAAVLVAAPDLRITSHISVSVIRKLPHRTGVSTAAWSPDGKQVATLSELFRLVTLWDSESGVLIREFDVAKPPQACNNLAFTPDGHYILAAQEPGERASQLAAAALWDVSSGDIANDIAAPFPDKGPRSNIVRLLSMSRDGSEIGLSTTSVGVPVALFYRADDWITPQLVSLGWDAAQTMAFSPDGHWLAIGTFGGYLHLFDTNQRRMVSSIQVYEPHTAGVGSIAFRPDGNRIAVGSGPAFHSRKRSDGSWEVLRTTHPLVVLEVSTGNVIEAVPGTTERILSLSWSDDGSILAAGEDDKRVHFRSADHLDQPSKFIALDGPAMSVAFAPNSLRFVAIGGKTAVIGEILAR